MFPFPDFINIFISPQTCVQEGNWEPHRPTLESHLLVCFRATKSLNTPFDLQHCKISKFGDNHIGVISNDDKYFYWKELNQFKRSIKYRLRPEIKYRLRHRTWTLEYRVPETHKHCRTVKNEFPTWMSRH